MFTTLTPINQTVSIPVINGYVAVPDLAHNKKLSLNIALTYLAGLGAKRVIKIGQTFLEFPPSTTPHEYPTDWYGILRALV